MAIMYYNIYKHDSDDNYVLLYFINMIGMATTYYNFL